MNDDEIRKFIELEVEKRLNLILGLDKRAVNADAARVREALVCALQTYTGNNRGALSRHLFKHISRRELRAVYGTFRDMLLAHPDLVKISNMKAKDFLRVREVDLTATDEFVLYKAHLLETLGDQKLMVGTLARRLTLDMPKGFKKFTEVIKAIGLEVEIGEDMNIYCYKKQIKNE